MATNTQIGKYNYCRITRTIGHRYEDGKKIPVKKQFYGSSKRDAERKYNLWVREQNIKPVTDDSITFGQILEKYNNEILNINASYSPGTRELYSGAYKAHLKEKPITKNLFVNITPGKIQDFYSELQISMSAIQTLHKFLKGFFKWASRNGYCENIIDNVVLPVKPVIKHQENIIVWRGDEIDKIMKADYYLHDLLVFALYTGMRISELLGLQYGDFDKNIIRVRRQYYRGEFIPPKCNKERIIPMHEKIREIVNINDHKSSELVFTTSLGTPLDYHNVNTSLKRFYHRIGVEPKKFHAYRATFITNLCRNGVPIQVASRLAGHENITVTAKYYAAIDYQELSDAIDRI